MDREHFKKFNDILSYHLFCFNSLYFLLKYVSYIKGHLPKSVFSDTSFYPITQ